MNSNSFQDDPVYGDPDDVWGDLDWREPISDFEKRLLKLTGRKYYPSEALSKRVKAIEKHTIGPTAKFPMEYIETILDWTAKKNRHRTVIILDYLIKAIRNPDNLSKYLSHRQANQSWDPQDYDINISW